MQSHLAFGIAATLSVGCTEPSAPGPVTAPTPATDPGARGALIGVERAGSFDVVDGAGLVKLTLPERPIVTGSVSLLGGVDVFDARAVIEGGAVDAELEVMTVKDGTLPTRVIHAFETLPALLAIAAGGQLVRDEPGTLVGFPGRTFEITTSDRHLFGWWIAAAPHARVYQLNCVGNYRADTRAACDKIFHTLALRHG